MLIDYPTLAREIAKQQVALDAPVVNRDIAEAITGRKGSSFYRWLDDYYGGPRPKDGRYVNRLLKQGMNKEAARKRKAI